MKRGIRKIKYQGQEEKREGEREKKRKKLKEEKLCWKREALKKKDSSK